MMKRIRLRTIFIFLLVAASGTLLLHTSQSVQKVEIQLSGLNKDVEHEKETIHLLKTEWAYLNNPARLETLAREYLKLKPSDVGNIKTDSASILPKPAVLPEEEIQAQPVAFTPPAPKLSPKTIPLKAPPKEEKTFNDLIKQVAKEGGE